MESELPDIVQVKVVAKNILLGPWGLPNYFCNVMSLFEETYKFSEPNCYT